MGTIGRFLAGIGAVVWEPEKARYLILRRSPEKDFAAGAWECPTGRVDQGEGFSDAVAREVREELGVDIVPDFVVGTTHFYRGAELPENELLGVIFHCTLRSPYALRLSEEHTELRWVTLPEAEQLLGSDHPSESWLLRILRRADALRRELPADAVALQRGKLAF